MKSIILIAAMLLICSAGYSQQRIPIQEDYFYAGQWNLDLYGTGSLKNDPKDDKDLRFGAGAGVTYFFTKQLGLGVRAESESTAHSVFDFVAGRVTFRAPISATISPYGFVQGGFRFERDAWEAGAGAGLEFKFKPNLGVYGEAAIASDIDGHGKLLGAAGVRLSF